MVIVLQFGLPPYCPVSYPFQCGCGELQVNQGSTSRSMIRQPAIYPFTPTEGRTVHSSRRSRAFIAHSNLSHVVKYLPWWLYIARRRPWAANEVWQKLHSTVSGLIPSCSKNALLGGPGRMTNLVIPLILSAKVPMAGLTIAANTEYTPLEASVFKHLKVSGCRGFLVRRTRSLSPNGKHYAALVEGITGSP